MLASWSSIVPPPQKVADPCSIDSKTSPLHTLYHSYIVTKALQPRKPSSPKKLLNKNEKKKEKGTGVQTVRSKYAAIRNIRVLYIPTSYRTAANNGEKKKKQTSVYRYIAAGQKRKPWKWLYFGEMPGQPAALRAFFTELGHPLHRRFHLLFVIIFFAAKRNTPASRIYTHTRLYFISPQREQQFLIFA